MMKRLIFFFAIASGIASCDKIEKPYKIEQSRIEVDTPAFPALENVVQKYLFEDYTGHLCNNCPEGAAILKTLKTAMGDTLIVMAVHAGANGMVAPNPVESGCSRGYTADYRTPAGNEYATTFNIKGNPSGMVNRMLIDGNRTFLNVANWTSIVNNIPRNAPTMGIQIIPQHRSDTAYIFIKTTLLSDVSQKLRLCAVLVENGIVSPQKNKDVNIGETPNICSYEHNHVLRTAITPIWGDVLDLSEKNDTIIKAYALLFEGKPWKKENCHIIVYIYDADTQEILQAEEKELF